MIIPSEAAVRYKVFAGSSGNSEYFISVTPAAGGSHAGQAASLAAGYARALKELGLKPGSAVFRRFFLADGAGLGALRKGHLPAVPGEGPVAVSVVAQPPLPGGKAALLAYHVQGQTLPRKRQVAPGHLAMEGREARHIWSTGLTGGSAAAPGRQTEKIFGELARVLRRCGGSLADSCLRTWLYLPDISRAYSGMVRARGEVFRRHGLTKETHFISSTGIEGAPAAKPRLLGLDAYSAAGLRPDQVSYLNDLSRLCRAADYNVTFERGTKVAYADRSHFYLSGTASIDREGNILHPGDALKQLKRTVGNMSALLKSGGGRLEDLMYLIVYLKRPADLPRLKDYLRKKFPGLPLVAVKGAVCRPGWLVEVEGVAAARARRPGLPAF
jgi:enamine deaminase RidA (YjgF/YER057c/UK114 family)